MGEEDPYAGQRFRDQGHATAEEARAWVDDQEKAAGSLAAVDALPRYVILIQGADGWTADRGHTVVPVMHEAVLLAVRRALGAT